MLPHVRAFLASPLAGVVGFQLCEQRRPAVSDYHTDLAAKCGRWPTVYGLKVVCGFSCVCSGFAVGSGGYRVWQAGKAEWKRRQAAALLRRCPQCNKVMKQRSPDACPQCLYHGQGGKECPYCLHFPEESGLRVIPSGRLRAGQVVTLQATKKGTARLDDRLYALAPGEQVHRRMCQPGHYFLSWQTEEGEASTGLDFTLRVVGEATAEPSSKETTVPPLAELAISPDIVVPGEVVVVRDLSWGGDGRRLAKRTLSWGDGEKAEFGPDGILSHVYTDLGDYEIQLTVVDNAGKEAQARRQFQVRPYDEFFGRILELVPKKAALGMSITGLDCLNCLTGVARRFALGIDSEYVLRMARS